MGKKSGFVKRLVKAISLIDFSFLLIFCNIYLFGSVRS